MKELSLNGTWKLRAEFIDTGSGMVREVLERAGTEGVQQILRTSEHRFPPNTFPMRKGALDAKVPCDVITPLIENGLIEEPFLKSNTNTLDWIKDLSWWFIRDFEVTEDLYDNDEVRLMIEMLDYKADIIINGVPAARHKNAFRAFCMDVKRFLRIGKNQIVIRLTSGVEDNYPHDSIAYYAGGGVINQRIYLRKPQFTYGWDWCKPVPTCGIGRDIRLTGFTGAEVTAFRADTVSVSPDKKSARLEVFFEIDKSDICTSEDAVLKYSLIFDGETVYQSEKEHYLCGGLNFITEHITIENPQLWWPNGYGRQNLYTVRASVSCRGIKNSMKEKRIGIRTLSISHAKREDSTRNFDFIVNGEKVFCKGGNWVPTDSVYLRTPAEKYRTLVREAKNANFTMLRIWGGGTYEPDCFYEYCSEDGILIMHDFMYACAYYPDHLAWFADEARQEADYQTKRLAHYPCMAVWTGNNEIHESYTDWFYGDIQPRWRHGGKIFNYIQPEAVRSHSPGIPYMPSSPYFGSYTPEIAQGKVPGMSTNPQRGKNANNPTSGDVHAWTYFGRDEETKMKFHHELEAFDRFVGRFSSEYGFFGALMESSVHRYLDGGEMTFDNPDWIHHGEQSFKHRYITDGIDRHLADSSTLDERDYLLYSGVMQGFLYLEMTEAMRMKPYGSGNLIWMYNDCWPETGWTIIDYYLTRKISFYYLKRAFAPKKLIVRVGNGVANVKAINETQEKASLTVAFGFMDFCGNRKDCSELSITLEPHSSQELALEAGRDVSGGFYYAIPSSEDFEPAISMRAYYRNYRFPEPQFRIVSADRDGSDLLLTVCSDTYVPVAFFKCRDDRTRMTDNYFSLLPGVEKTVRIFDCPDVPELLAVGPQPNESLS